MAIPFHGQVPVVKVGSPRRGHPFAAQMAAEAAASAAVGTRMTQVEVYERSGFRPKQQSEHCRPAV